jgi:protein dithiol oxidoreductase (disulfide-forming)
MMHLVYANKLPYLKSVLLALSLSFFSSFSSANTENALKGIEKTGNIQTADGVVEIFKKLNIPSEKKAVRYFFSYTCPFSRKYDLLMAKWGATLPKHFIYARVPIVSDEGGYFAAISYYTVAIIAPDKLNNYQEEVYKQIQDRRKSTVEFDTYAEAAYRVGIDVKKFADVVLTNRTHNLVANGSMLAAKYQVDLTPYIGVGGKYGFSSELIDPKNGNLTQLSNAMVSKFISEFGISTR